jgi:plasmid stabilization system protein ParE
VKLRVARRALVEGDRAARWWRKNRLSNPDLFEEELDAALDLVRTAPALGSPCGKRRGRQLRRVMLPRTRYHLYYCFEPGDDHALVLSIWSAVRGRGPRLA